MMQPSFTLTHLDQPDYFIPRATPGSPNASVQIRKRYPS